MKLLITLVVVSAVSVNAGSDWKMFMKWAKTKAMESCWGEENMKLHTLNMKKAVSKCLQVDAPETDLPPFRYLNRFTNNLVNMANNRHQYGYEHGDAEMMKLMKMMIMVKMMNSFGGHNEDHHSLRHGCNGFHDCDDNNYTRKKKSPMMEMLIKRFMKSQGGPQGLKEPARYEYIDMDDSYTKAGKDGRIMVRLMKSQDGDDYDSIYDYSDSFGGHNEVNGYSGDNKIMMMMRNAHKRKKEKYENMDSPPRYEYMDMDHMDNMEMFSKMFRSMISNNNYSPMMKRFMSSFQKRQAGDSLELNDRLKEKLERLMEEHVSEMSNMTCVLREMNVLDTRNKIDIAAMKADVQNYQMPSEWFKDQYFAILDNCQEVAENQPAELDNMYNMPGMQHLGTVKSFMTCAKTAKMRLCMNQDTKKKIETNFGPVEELLQSFNNQINEEQLFFMVNELLQGDDQEWM